MNYQKIYDSLIVRSRNRILVGYIERHHIIPKCMGGTNEPSNLAELTPEEHFLCHQLLLKIYRGTEWASKMAYACHMMTRSFSGRADRNTSKLKMFGWLRRAHSEALKQLPAHNKGKPHSAEHKAKIAASLVGRILSPKSEETKQKISDSLSGRLFSEERKARLRQKPRKSIDTREKLSLALKGKPKSEVTKSNMRKPKARVQCTHCQKIVSPGTLSRWHNNNCKFKERN